MNCPQCQFAHAIISAPLFQISHSIKRSKPSGYAFVCPICQCAFSVTSAGITRAAWQAKPVPADARERDPRQSVNSPLDGMKLGPKVNV